MGKTGLKLCGRAFSHHQRPGSKRWFSKTTHSHTVSLATSLNQARCAELFRPSVSLIGGSDRPRDMV